MQRNMIQRASLAGERFHNLVSSRLVTPIDWIDDSGELKTTYECNENWQAVEYLDTLRSAVKKIAHSTTAAWVEQRYGSRGLYVLSVEARVLWHAFRSVALAPKAWGRERHMHPYVAIGVRLARKWEPRLRGCTNTRSDLLIAEEYPRRIIGHIVRVIRRVSSSESFQRRVQQLARQQRDNANSCRNYFLAILRSHARPLLLRVDLYVDGEAKKAALEGKIELAVEKFVRSLRESRIIPDVLGYIVRREAAYDRGIHFHVMVMVDGDEHAKTYGLTEMLKQYWIDECVGSPTLASGFNCYLRKDEYPFNALGHVHYADENALRGVRHAINYLVKTDGHFLVPETFGKNLRKGQAPRPRSDGRRRGAPRKHGSDVSLAERILFETGDPPIAPERRASQWKARSDARAGYRYGGARAAQAPGS